MKVSQEKLQAAVEYVIEHLYPNKYIVGKVEAVDKGLHVVVTPKDVSVDRIQITIKIE